MPLRQKVVFVMIDGVGDINQPSLSPWQTPLQKAKIPNMDLLSEFGANGLMDPVETGLACGSDTAHMSIFGYDPRKHYRGRGSFESMGAGLEMIKGDIAFKSNFATWNAETGVVEKRRADREFEHIGPILCDYLNHIPLPNFPEYQVEVKYATEHRCGVRVRGKNLSGDITGTDPLRDNLKLKICKPKKGHESDKSAVLTSKLVNELSREFYKKLELHPINLERQKQGKNMANCILLRGCGVRIEVPTFQELHGWKGFMIAPTAIIAGLGLSIQMDLIKVPGATGDYHTNVLAKQEYCCKTIKKEDYDFGFLHIKAVDDSGHDGNLSLKISLLEKVDIMMGKLIQDLCDDMKQNEQNEYTIVVTGDHTTPVLYKDHSFEPVPFVICKLRNIIKQNRSDEEVDAVKCFSEIDASAGVLGRFPGIETFSIIKNYIS